jgi:hypothetical protein
MAEGKQRGRPPKTPGEAKRASFNTRLRSGLKEALEESARGAGRSLSEEIEFRLEQSFEREHWLGDTRTVALLQVLANLVRLESGERHWLDDFYAFSAITDLWRRIVESKRPPTPEEVTRRVVSGRQTLERLKRDDLDADVRGRLLTLVSFLAGDTTLPDEARAEFANAVAGLPMTKG